MASRAQELNDWLWRERRNIMRSHSIGNMSSEDERQLGAQTGKISELIQERSLDEAETLLLRMQHDIAAREVFHVWGKRI